VYALFAAAPGDVDIQLDPQAKAAAEAYGQAISGLMYGPVGIGMGLLGLVALVLFVWVIVVMFQKGSTGLGIATILTTFCGIGPLLAFIVGWVKSGEWKIRPIMGIWTLVILLQIATSAYFGYAFTQASTKFFNDLQQIQKDKEKNMPKG